MSKENKGNHICFKVALDGVSDMHGEDVTDSFTTSENSQDMPWRKTK
jgi:hypothetical protein